MTERPPESALMRTARALGRESLAWSLRRIHCPVPPDALVLEVGSGGNPYARANVLLDAYADTRERHWAPLTVDRPFVFGFLERLPFRDKAFDFIIASHVLEHSPEPARALAEMERVARAGYIEVPDAFMERVNPYKDHRAEITVRGGRLLIRKKPAWVVDAELLELYLAHAKDYVAGKLIPARPFAFHVRHYWEDRIDFEIVNPQIDAAWAATSDDRPRPPRAPRRSWRDGVRTLLRRAMSQTARNRAIDLDQLVACADCHGPLVREHAAYRCDRCQVTYGDRDGLPMLYPVRA